MARQPQNPALLIFCVCHVLLLVRQPLLLSSVNEFAGKRVFAGKKKSGAYITFQNLLDVAGIGQNTITLVEPPVDSNSGNPPDHDSQTVEPDPFVMQAFRQDTVDIVVFVTALPNQTMRLTRPLATIKSLLDLRLASPFRVDYGLRQKIATSPLFVGNGYRSQDQSWSDCEFLHTVAQANIESFSLDCHLISQTPFPELLKLAPQLAANIRNKEKDLKPTSGNIFDRGLQWLEHLVAVDVYNFGDPIDPTSSIPRYPQDASTTRANTSIHDQFNMIILLGFLFLVGIIGYKKQHQLLVYHQRHPTKSVFGLMFLALIILGMFPHH